MVDRRGAGGGLADVRAAFGAGMTRLALRRVRRLADGYVPRTDGAGDRLRALGNRLLAPDEDGSVDEALKGAVVTAFEALYQPTQEQELPAADVRAAIVDQFHRLYYHDSRSTWKDTYYRGVHVQKCPLDLWQYQELVSELRPDLIIETGTAYGGSAYYLGDLCDTVGHGRVVTIDVAAPPRG
jgi:hypothetical protein